MLFNSHEFVFGFLPVTLVVFFMLGRVHRNLALGWLIVASLIFYAWWRPINVLIIAPAILIDYLLARTLMRLAPDPSRSRGANAVLVLGIVFNVLFLGYFKYTNFLANAVNDATGANFVVGNIILPLGISFITFQKIAFLIDVHAQRIKEFTLREYGVFVLFFPQLVAGPIVHFREMMPQFRETSCRFDAENLGVGLTMFCIGLFKKVVLADGVAMHVTPIYGLAESGGTISLIPAWIAAVGFTLQIYFDFSGYSDMALGLGRCFGIKLPPNFDSPLKATSIIDFWLRWHMTLTRFLTAYLYNPIVLALTRRRFARGLPSLSAKRFNPGAFLQLLAGPTILTMLVSGLWHGAGYLFILWGLLHGIYLTINHAWRQLSQQFWKNRDQYVRVMRPVGHVLTFLSVAFAMVLFRATTVGSAKEVITGLIGLNGVVLPRQIFDVVAPIASHFERIVTVTSGGALADLAVALSWIAGLFGIAMFAPNSLELLSRYEPALGVKPRVQGGVLSRVLSWQPNLPWAIAISAVAATAVLSLGHRTEFLYWQF